ncbi:hypothetical protein BpHYR1_014962 [Brachionus plicatilis]|uniref:Uncharacterized protein n=1 Tax=Brachionus plicatilis TaxID=10195 RepID=A0A3M7QTH2_BRAPC|nr:hypothetical protein BpHYR1_014962 [Brachionus plicatilis]
MNTFRSETKDLLGSSFSDESGSANFFSTSLSCSSSYSSSLTPSRQLLLESTSENMDVIKEFRNLFLEKYLEKNKIGRRSKLLSKHRNQKGLKSCVDKNMEGENKVEYQSSCGKEEFDKFQIEFFNNDLLDVKAQSYSLSMNSYDEDSYENMNKISNSYTGNYESSYVSYYNPYYECHEKASEFFSNSLPMTSFSYDPTARYCPKNSLENEPHLRSSNEAEGLRRISIMENENYRLTEDDNKIFNLEIESELVK